MRYAVPLLLCLLLFSGCSSLLFYPHSTLVRTPADIGIEYRDINFTSGDGTALHGWLLPAKQQPAIASVLFLHGNGENISTHIGSVYWMPERGINVFLIDYRGYGRSAGEASLQGVHEDAERAVSVLLQQPESEGLPLVLFGQSLGGAVALHTAANSAYRDVIKAVIAESSFSSYRGIAREVLAGFWLTWPLQWPGSLIISDAYHPGRAVEQLSDIPVLLIHGDQDNIVGPQHSERLYSQAAGAKELWIVPGGVHINAFSREAYRERLVNYLNALSKQP